MLEDEESALIVGRVLRPSDADPNSLSHSGERAGVRGASSSPIPIPPSASDLREPPKPTPRRGELRETLTEAKPPVLPHPFQGVAELRPPSVPSGPSAPTAQLRAKDLANRLGVSAQWLRVLARRRFKQPLRTWLAQGRWRAFVKMLRSGASAKQIASLLGYNHAANLSRSLKKQTGKTFRQLRAELKAPRVMASDPVPSHSWRELPELPLMKGLRMKRICLACLLITFAAMNSTLAQPRYTVQLLRPVIGESATVDSINDLGDMAGTAWAEDWNLAEVFRLRTGNPVEWLGIFSTWYDLAYINNQGQVAGTYWFDHDNRILHGFVYTDGVGMLDIGTLGGLNTVVFALNNLGQVTGVSHTEDNPSDEPNRAFRYSPGLGIQPLGTLPGGTFSAGFAINDLGSVAGGTDTTNGVTHEWPDERTYHAFRYTDESGIIDAGGLPLGGASDGYAIAMNGLGVIVGVSGGGGAPEVGFTPRRGFIAYNSTIQELPGLGGNDTVPVAVNDANVVVGRDNLLDRFGSPVVRRAFIWAEREGILDLNDLIALSNGLSLSSAVDINNRGQIVAESNQGPVLLDPIPPRLRISNLATNLALSWTPHWPGLVLEATDNLVSTNWQALATGGTNVISLPSTNSMRFFRLNLDALRGLCCGPQE